MDAGLIDILIKIITLDGITPNGLLVAFILYQAWQHNRHSKKVDETIKASLERNAKALEEVAQGVKTSAETFKALTEWNKEMCKEVKEEIKGIDKTAQAILNKVA